MEISNRKLFSRGIAAIGFAVAFSGVPGGAFAAEQPEVSAAVAPSGAENHESIAQEEAGSVACTPDSGPCTELSAQEEAARRAKFAEQDRRLNEARKRRDFEKRIEAVRAAIAKLANSRQNLATRDNERRRLLGELEALKLAYGKELLAQAKQAAADARYSNVVLLATEAREVSRPEKQPDGSQAESPLLTEVNTLLELCRTRQPSSVTPAPPKPETLEEALDGVIAELSDTKKNFGTLGEERLRLFRREREALRLADGKELLGQARQAAAEQRYPTAIQLATEAREAAKSEDGSLGDSPLLAEVGDFIEYCQTRQHALETRQATSVTNTFPQHAANEERIKQLLAEARVFYHARRYDEAVSRLEEVYLIDPLQREAIQLLNDIYKQVYTAGLHRREADIAGVQASDIWQWVEPVFPVRVQSSVPEGIRKDSAEQGTQAKLERIIWKNFECENANVSTVLKDLRDRNRGFDPEKEGVNISYSFGGRNPEEFPPLTMRLSNIPLSELIRYVCQNTGLKYRVEESGVTIGPNVDEMQRRSFHVRSELISSITGSDVSEETPPGGEQGNPPEGGNGGDMPAGEGGEGGELSKNILNGGATPRASITSQALVDYFSKRGVEFGPGSSISYEKRAGRLIVNNTPENLQRFDELIRQLDAIQTPLVMVEIKGIEISETDLQELGFDWSMDAITRNLTLDSDGNTTLKGDAERGWAFFQGERGGGILGKLKNTRGGTANDALWNMDRAVVNHLNIFPAIFGKQSIFGSDVPFNLYLTVNALSQNSRTETLSAPKVMTTSGNKASTRMVKSYWFPTEWDEYEVDVDEGDVDITVPNPDFEEFDDVGITFDVTPVVNPDNYTITLDLNPSFRKFIGKDEYLMKVVAERLWRDQRMEETYTFNVWMPIISSRKLHVNVTVYDGETIVLGGMIDSSVNQRTDKWPLLGDLPFVGRFFSSQAEDTVRNNLLLFVTTRLVNQDGIPIRRGQQNGAPDFNR